VLEEGRLVVGNYRRGGRGVEGRGFKPEIGGGGDVECEWERGGGGLGGVDRLECQRHILILALLSRRRIYVLKNDRCGSGYGPEAIRITM